MSAPASSEPPLLIRILMVGDSSVGKTSMVLRYDKRGYNPKFTTTIGVDYSDRLLDITGRQVKLQIWDTAGQERFHSLTTSFFKRAEGFVLVYDVGSKESFESMERWMRDISEQGKMGCNVVICGNKADIPVAERQVTEAEGQALAKKYGTPYMETSAKDNLNVDETFTSLATAIKERIEGGGNARVNGESGVSLESSADLEDNSCC